MLALTQLQRQLADRHECHHLVEDGDEVLCGVRAAIVEVRNVGRVGHFLPNGAVPEGRGQYVGPYPFILLTKEALDPRTNRARAGSGQQHSRALCCDC